MLTDSTCNCRLQIKISMDAASDQPLEYDVKIFVVGAENLFSISQRLLQKANVNKDILDEIRIEAVLCSLVRAQTQTT